MIENGKSNPDVAHILADTLKCTVYESINVSNGFAIDVTSIFVNPPERTGANAI